MYFETKGLVSIKGGKGLLAGTSTTAPTNTVHVSYEYLDQKYQKQATRVTDGLMMLRRGYGRIWLPCILSFCHLFYTSHFPSSHGTRAPAAAATAAADDRGHPPTDVESVAASAEWC